LDIGQKGGHPAGGAWELYYSKRREVERKIKDEQRTQVMYSTSKTILSTNKKIATGMKRFGKGGRCECDEWDFKINIRE
jgi:hypothetical protein